MCTSPSLKRYIFSVPSSVWLQSTVRKICAKKITDFQADLRCAVGGGVCDGARAVELRNETPCTVNHEHQSRMNIGESWANHEHRGTMSQLENLKQFN